MAEIEYLMYSNAQNKEQKQVLQAGVEVFGKKFTIEVDSDGLHIRGVEK